MVDGDSPQVGTVYLVGAGPGDPGLITWRGVECLARADLVLYDYLVNPRILRHAPAEAERICLGRHGRGRIMPQAEVHERMIAAARSGRTVVRLKGGDPVIFARLREELNELSAAGIPFEIVPGVTAALAAGSHAGICFTDRDDASAVALVTGREQASKESSLDYAALARFPGTIVVYMGLTSAADWTKALIAGGKPSETPAAIVQRCSWPDQHVIVTTLGRVPEDVATSGLRPPAIVIVGPVAGAPASFQRFRRLPLLGKRIMITRPKDQTGLLESRLSELGADCLLQPAIEIGPPQDWQPVDAALGRLDEYHWVVFSSTNGVSRLLDRLLERGADVRRLAGLKIAAIGPGTADELARYHLVADLEPAEFRAEALAAALVETARGQRFLLARASRGREVLAEQLIAAGGIVDQVVVYNSRDAEQPDPEVAADLAAGRIDWITVTSSAIAGALAKLFGDDLRKSKLATISPITSAAVRQLGFEPTAEATEYSMAGLVKAILHACTN